MTLSLPQSERNRRRGAAAGVIAQSVLHAWLLLLGAGCAHPTAPIPAPETDAQSVRPDINRQFLDPNLDVEQWVERFESESREIYAQRHEIVEAVGLEPGDAVADLGAGSGLFSALFAAEVGPRGTVYAVDIAPGFVRHIEENAERAGLNQIRGVVCEQDSVGLPPDSVDLAFICDTYHHFEYPAPTMASIHRALRRGGELVVIDFHRIPGTSSDWVMDHVRDGQEVFTAEIEAAGFRKVEERPILEENYFLRFRKR
jgi:SAM-dependent methyltransferase